MNVCGVLVHTFPARIADVESALGLMPGVEVHARTEDSRLIVTVEDTPTAAASDGVAAIHALSGVVAAILVYHHFEPDDSSLAGGDLTS